MQRTFWGSENELHVFASTHRGINEAGSVKGWHRAVEMVEDALVGCLYSEHRSFNKPTRLSIQSEQENVGESTVVRWTILSVSLCMARMEEATVEVFGRARVQCAGLSKSAAAVSVHFWSANTPCLWLFRGTQN